MGTIYTIEGNTSAGNTLVANGGCVAEKSYAHSYSRISKIFYPKFRKGEAAKVVAEAKKWIGYLEKKSNFNLASFTGNAGYKNYTYFAKMLKKWGIYDYQGQPWCDMFVDFVFIQALGVERARELLGGFSAYTPTSANYLRKAGATQQTVSTALPGAVIFFENTTRICHTGIVTGEFVDVVIESDECKYTQEDFVKEVCAILKVKTAKKALKKTATLSRKKNKNHALVLPLQKRLKALDLYSGVADRDFGTLTELAVDDYQRTILHYRRPDGEVTAGNKMWKSLLGLE